jgi:hypothetical protein
MSMAFVDRVQVARRFTRAVRVDADLHDVGALDGYICSQSAIETLLLMARHRGATGHGAFTWTGPYGSGKSSLAVLFGALLGASHTKAMEILLAIPEMERAELAAAFRQARKGWLVIPVVGRRGAVEACIGEAIATAVGGKPNLAAKPREALASWISRIVASNTFAGVLLLIDEMGKFLEDAARTGGDVHAFQDLAELSARSDGKLMVVGILHQAFDEYAHRLARDARDEWIKVQGRYVDLPINLANDEQLELIGRAIESDDKPNEPSAIDLAVATSLRAHRPTEERLLAVRLSECWPLHPVVAALLGPISRRRFGQNQRSLFGFLNSVEPFGFQSFLADTKYGDVRFPVERLWDYLHANLEPAILASPDGHRWSTALEALSRAETRGATEQHLILLKAIALIDLFKDRSGLQASANLLEAIAAPLGRSKVSSLLNDLVDWSVIIFRKHVGSFSIYAGSDFDIEAAVEKARQVGVGVDYRRLARYATLQPVLAKRHYEATGALRWFEIELTPLQEVEDRVRSYRPAPGAAGLFLLVISGNAESAAEAKRALKKATEHIGERLIVLGWARDSYMIREMASDLAALEHVRATQPELEGDAIARREVDARLARLAADLEDRLSDAVNGVQWQLPNSAEHLFAHRVTGPAGLSVLASRLADWRYPSAPMLPNELVNRTRPSSNAAAAMRALLRAMVERPNEPRLGIQSYPPEAGLYIGLLRSTGLHHESNPDTWEFSAPAPEDRHRLAPLWTATDALLASRDEGTALAEIYDIWRKPPFGVRDGLLPILAVTYLMTRAGQCAVYLDGAFKPAPDSFFVDRLLQEPGSIRLRAVSMTDIDRAFIAALASDLSPEEAIEPTPLAVARALVKQARDLPTWTLRTGRLSETATRLRDRLKVADDPNRLLIDELPIAIGLEGADHSGADIAARILDALTELRDAYPAMLAELEQRLLKELRVRGDGEASLEVLRRRAATVRSLTGNFRLDALATRLSSFGGSLEELEGLASLAANKPAKDWVDRDVDAARIELAALAQQFLRAEGFARLKDRPDGRVAMAVYISDPNYPEPTACEVEISIGDQRIADGLADRIAALIEQEALSPEIAIAALANLGLRLVATDGPTARERTLA